MAWGRNAQISNRPGVGAPGPIRRDPLPIEPQCRLYVLISERSSIGVTGDIDDPALIEAVRRFFGDRRPS